MSLVNQIFCALFVTALTGTLAFFTWQFAGRKCIRLHPRMPYLLLRIVCVLYVLPINYFAIQLLMRDGFMQIDGVWQMNFYPVGVMKKLLVILMIGWTILTGRQILVCLFASYKRRSFCHQNMPEKDEAVLAEFARIKEKLHIRRKIVLYRNDKIVTPMTYGILRCRIVLPEQNYSREQLSVIFHHELTHCKNCDVFFKLCGRCVGVVYHLGFISRRINELIDEWSEYDCDMKAVEAISDEMDVARYFGMIVDSMVESLERQDVNHIFVGLYENRLRLERRIDFMKKYGNIKKKTSGVLAVAALLFALVNVTTVYAASDKVSKEYDKFYQSEEVPEQIGYQVDDTEEYFLPAEEDDTYEVLEYAGEEAVMPLLDEEEIVNINWSVSSGVRKLTTAFEVEAGQVIVVSTVGSPASCTYWLGLMDEDGNVRYVQGTGGMSYDFEIEESGKYRVLVQNRGRVTLKVTGGYYFYTPTEEDTEE